MRVKTALLTTLVTFSMLSGLASCTLERYPAGEGYVVAGDISGSVGGPTFFKGNALLARLDSAGNDLWVRKLRDGSRVYCIQMTSEGHFAAVGEIDGGDLYLAEVDASGKVLLERKYEGKPYERGRSVQKTSDGGFIVCGEIEYFDGKSWQLWLTKLSPTGNVEWSNAYGSGLGGSAIQTHDGGYVVTGSMAVGSPYNYEGWLAKTDRLGAIVWEKRISPESMSGGRAIKETTDGYVITGTKPATNARGSDVSVVRTNKDGGISWAKSFSYSGGDLGYAIEVVEGGGLAITTVAGRVIRLDSDGSVSWERVVSVLSDMADVEEAEFQPSLPLGQGYIVAVEKRTHELPVRSPGGMPVRSPVVSQMLVFTFIDENGQVRREASLDLGIKRKP
jgi:hypothetical protein